MGAMKSLHYRWTVLGWRPGARQAEVLGLTRDVAAVAAAEKAAADAELVAAGAGVPEPRRTAEEIEAEKVARREESEAAREARLEREAIQAVEREADERIRLEEEAAKPKTFAPPPPDFVRSDRPPVPDHAGLACPWPSMAAMQRCHARAIADQAAGRTPPAQAGLRERTGPPEAPAVPTGWYQIDGGSYCRVGSWPFPEYRPPGLVWRPTWTAPKPDDVPWEDEAETAAMIPTVIPPRVDAAEPTPPRPLGGKLKQGSLF